MLIADLKEKSSERISKIWSDAEEKIDELRQTMAKEFELRQKEVLNLLESEAVKVAVPIIHDVERTALSIEDNALRDLSMRLF